MNDMTKKKKRNPIATILVAIGIIALIGAALWYVRNLIEDISAEHASREIVTALSNVIEEKTGEKTDDKTDDKKEDDPDGSKSDDKQNAETDSADDYSDPAKNDPKYMRMETEKVDEIAYIGIIEIPSASLKLPVSYEWSYELLAISPCRYRGSYLTDDMVICAHDYGSHFRAIRSLGIGESVYFTAVTGERIKYIVTNVETVQPTDIEKLAVNKRSDDGETLWDLTLFTCNIGGQTRCAVRLDRAK